VTRAGAEHKPTDVLWPALAEAAGDDELAARQRKRYEELGVQP